MSFVNQSNSHPSGLPTLLLNRFIVFPSGIFLGLYIKADTTIAFLQNSLPSFGLWIRLQHTFSVCINMHCVNFCSYKELASHWVFLFWTSTSVTGRSSQDWKGCLRTEILRGWVLLASNGGSGVSTAPLFQLITVPPIFWGTPPCWRLVIVPHSGLWSCHGHTRRNQ